MWDIIFYVVFALLLVTSVLEFFIIRGFMRHTETKRSHRSLTGREIEELRRKLSTIGMSTIKIDDVFNLIKTIRETHLGNYVDEDPYIPADPYEDI